SQGSVVIGGPQQGGCRGPRCEGLGLRGLVDVARVVPPAYSNIRPEDAPVPGVELGHVLPARHLSFWISAQPAAQCAGHRIAGECGACAATCRRCRNHGGDIARSDTTLTVPLLAHWGTAAARECMWTIRVDYMQLAGRAYYA